MSHLPNYYNDEQWNNMTDEERQMSLGLAYRASETSIEDLNEQIQALYDEADEWEANAEGTSDIMRAQALRNEAEQLIGFQRDMRADADGH